MNKKLLVIISIAFLSVVSFLAINFWPKKISEIQIQSNAPVETKEDKDNETENVEGVSEPGNAEEISTSPIPEESKAKTESINIEENKTPETETETPEVKVEPEKKTAAFQVNSKIVSWGHQKSSDRKIDTIIIHSSYNSLGGDPYDLGKILDIYESYGVAAHYIITLEGKIYQLVENKNIAYHAGVSEVPDGRQNVNNFSIGIEIINSKIEGPTKAQYENLKKLITQLKDEYKIKYVLGHSDIAPGRKDDPWKFDWGKVK